MIRLAIAGATGRTGSRVLELAGHDDQFEVVAALVAPGSLVIGGKTQCGQRNLAFCDTLKECCDVLIDFTTPAGTMSWLDVCQKQGIALVCGVTGHDDRHLSRLAEAARQIPVLHASSFSCGIEVLGRLIVQLAQELGPAYDVEIIETHHRHKVDAPSGTAMTLLARLAEATGRTMQSNAIFGRSGPTAERPTGQIGVHSVRMGDHVGTHEVHFSGLGETLTIRHVAHSRDIFAAGALRAAAWIVRQPSVSLYTLGDMMSASRCTKGL